MADVTITMSQKMVQLIVEALSMGIDDGLFTTEGHEQAINECINKLVEALPN